jgi:hypothetical protein
MKYVHNHSPFQDTLTCQAESSAYEKIMFYDVKVYSRVFYLVSASIGKF